MESRESEPVVSVGDHVKIYSFHEDSRVVKKYEVRAVNSANKRKHDSWFIYELEEIKTQDLLKTRLLHLEWRLVKEANLLKSTSSSITATNNLKKLKLSLPIHKYILAPMVQYLIINGLDCLFNVSFLA